MRTYLFKAAVLFCLSFTASCHYEDLDKIKAPTISPHIALNLGYSEYTMGELINDLDDESLELVTGEDQLLYMYFKDSTYYNQHDDLIEIGTVSNTELFEPNIAFPVTPAAYTIDINETFNFTFASINGEEIDSVVYNGGTLDFDMVSTFKGDIDYTWVIEGTKDVATNQDLTSTQQLFYTGAEVIDDYSRPLLGLKSKFRKNGSNENEFTVTVTGTITFDGEEILPTDKMVFDLSYTNSEFSKIYGNFGSDPVVLHSHSIEMAAFDQLSGDGLKLKDPQVLLITENSYGMDMELVFDEVKAVASDNSEIQLEDKTPPGIDGFVSSPEKEGEVEIDTVILDSKNSNIDELLNSAPERMEFSVSGIPNPSKSTRLSNFLLEESEVKVVSVIAIPMQFQMDGFSVDFDFALDGLDVEDAEQIVFNLVATNEIPFAGNIDLKFLDSDGQVLFSLGNAALIESPELDAEGKTKEPKLSASTIDLTREGIDALLNTDKILAVANISTFEHEEGRFVDLYSDYILKIDLSLAGEVTIAL
ncbi:hypothetical protein N7E81_16450 [Reichenbachiella carrageenanivorans]|uniref:Uncharacterized protein n=1 Tax=Reichenbachiella carrageenanivorans TaxID=2979869 RepID=A0ABY6CYF3_9BACT|nr:hypothetical protein [Reichenbachiella carrageenanivorans]UXX78946.1 hypothetical protein N7E81_16450 [Reichenbachiella carrageenanivorans]